MKTCVRCDISKNNNAFDNVKSMVCKKCKLSKYILRAEDLSNGEDKGFSIISPDINKVKILPKYIRPQMFVSYNKAKWIYHNFDSVVLNKGTIYVKEFMSASKEDFLTKINVMERDNYVCAYCGKETNTVNHIIPISEGGETTLENLIASCNECNMLKADISVKIDAEITEILKNKENLFG